MKRFFERAEAFADDGAAGVRLDGRPLRTPAGALLRLPGHGLAEAIAAEWQEQEEEIRPAAMPLTRLAATVVDRMPALRQQAIAECLEQAQSDLLCYRMPHPRGLARRQERCWQPWLDWAARELGVRLHTTDGILPVAQPEETMRTVEGILQALDDWRLVGLHAVVSGSGSLVLGLAVLEGGLAMPALFELALLEELWETERWGRDAEQQARQEAIRRDLDAACRFLALLG